MLAELGFPADNLSLEAMQTFSWMNGLCIVRKNTENLKALGMYSYANNRETND